MIERGLGTHMLLGYVLAKVHPIIARDRSLINGSSLFNEGRFQSHKGYVYTIRTSVTARGLDGHISVVYEDLPSSFTRHICSAGQGWRDVFRWGLNWDDYTGPESVFRVLDSMADAILAYDNIHQPSMTMPKMRAAGLVAPGTGSYCESCSNQLTCLAVADK